ncbi:Regulator of protease activity HflC, stomatin/prohibitin superfamily [Seinonella peptonophila]|uniref:Regulator of protease activity HflC, stomatin/prohibitin superfamily n=1 Tax=Seinonella peptonophila TaxID=112248 RepID=A0A1M5BHQ5_9BACL|nr:prohibitin family protein [Seinonella peptonophila]SHF41956.1 Regulator of protease activity HflC, stomatin/prohibitin superfamily [Seinonella peptonophila]
MKLSFTKKYYWYIGIAILVLIFLSTTIIEPGYKGLVFSLNGGVKKDVLDQGLNFHAPSPFNKITQYPVSTETVYLTQGKEKDENDDDQSFDVNTADGKSVNVDIVYSYHMNEQKLSHIFTKFRRKTHKEIEQSYIKTQIKTITQEVTTKYSVLGVYTEQRAKVTKEIFKNLSATLSKDGIILENFALSDVRPDEKTLKSLQAIADAQNRQEFLKREEKNKQQEAINNKIEAEGKKQVSIIEAEGKAEANAKLNSSLNPQLIQYEWIKRWNGKLPSVQGSGNLVQIPPITETK